MRPSSIDTIETLAGPSESPAIAITVFGDFQVERQGHVCELPPSRKTRALLAYLAVTGRPQRREKLCEMFWDLPDDPRGALRWSLSKIRSVVRSESGEDPIVADRNTVALRPGNCVLDCGPFLELAESDLERMDTAVLERMVPVVRGHFLENLSMPNCPAFEAWRLSVSDSLDLAVRRLLRVLVDRLNGTPERCLPYLHQLQRLDPENEVLSREITVAVEAARRATTLTSSAPDASVVSSRRQGFSLVPVGPRPEIQMVATPEHAHPATTRGAPQKIRFCRAGDGTRLAFTMTGHGPPLVRAAHWLSHLRYDYESPIWRHWVEGLQENFTYLRYDERANGLSDWNVKDLTFEAMVADLEAVVDAAGIERFALLGISQGCASSIAYAVRHPERVSALILYGGYARGWRKRGNADEIAQREALGTLMRLGWGRDNPFFRMLFTQRFVPGATTEHVAWIGDLLRHSILPENACRLQAMTGDIDVTELLPQVKVPTLVMHASGDVVAPFESGKELASGIPNAAFVPLDSMNHILLSGEPAFARLLGEVREFAGGASAHHRAAEDEDRSESCVNE